MKYIVHHQGATRVTSHGETCQIIPVTLTRGADIPNLYQITNCIEFKKLKINKKLQLIFVLEPRNGPVQMMRYNFPKKLMTREMDRKEVKQIVAWPTEYRVSSLLLRTAVCGS